ncbi:cyclin H [Acrasis kona]|uniref:Cyclin H n=1 Tax=Acrasis kona TaxID=1008807 RepID=A0AAW2ZJH0_9EUKA
MPFNKSSQYKFWFFDKEEKLLEIRKAINSSATDRILSYKSASPPKEGKKKKKDRVKQDDLLSVDDEYLILIKNIQKASLLCMRFNFPLHVEASAIMFFKRFFLGHSIMEYDISKIMLTCIYISCKAEDYYQDLSHFLAKVQEVTTAEVDPKEILKLELVVLQGLQFHMLVYHPYRSVFAFVHDPELTKSLRISSVNEIYEASKLIVRQSFLTDASFLFPPGLIALSSLHQCVVDDSSQQSILRYVQAKFGHQEQVTNSLNTIANMLQESKTKMGVDTSVIEKKFVKLRKIVSNQQKETEKENNKIAEKKEQERRDKKTEERSIKEEQDTKNLLG